jgi:hypothetical protein
VSAGLHPQIRPLIAAAGLAVDPPGPVDPEAERAAYRQTARELGGPVEQVARVEDVVIPRADGGCAPVRTGRACPPTRSVC